jgi:hypothetical protein
MDSDDHDGQQRQQAAPSAPEQQRSAERLQKKPTSTLTHICSRNLFLSNYDKFVQNNLQTTTQMIIEMKLINLLN